MAALAQPDLSVNMATRPQINDKGGANNIVTPARSAKGELHPNPGTPKNCAPAKSQGNAASQKLIFPNLFDFMLY